MYRLPLAAYRVLDLGPTAAVAYASRLLGDGGAEVIRVEGVASERSALFEQLNRDKLGCAFDIASPRGAGLLRRLVARCDIVVEGFEASETKRLGLTYEALRSARPDIIVASIHGTNGATVTALDVVAGTGGAAAVCAALLHHRDSGEGQHVAVDAGDCARSFRGVDAARVPSRAEMSSEAKPRERGFFEPVSLRGAVVEMPALPWRFSLTPCHVRLPAPEPGEHNRYVFGELLGLSEEEIAQLERERVVAPLPA
jgi:crotonobetainyl-CoA:carnitine CoA-transferase CaiB-like acyl-CoA transferase